MNGHGDRSRKKLRHGDQARSPSGQVMNLDPNALSLARAVNHRELNAAEETSWSHTRRLVFRTLDEDGRTSRFLCGVLVDGVGVRHIPLRLRMQSVLRSQSQLGHEQPAAFDASTPQSSATTINLCPARLADTIA